MKPWGQHPLRCLHHQQVASLERPEEAIDPRPPQPSAWVPVPRVYRVELTRPEVAAERGAELRPRLVRLEADVFEDHHVHPLRSERLAPPDDVIVVQPAPHVALANVGHELTHAHQVDLRGHGLAEGPVFTVESNLVEVHRASSR